MAHLVEPGTPIQLRWVGSNPALVNVSLFNPKSFKPFSQTLTAPAAFGISSKTLNEQAELA